MGVVKRIFQFPKGTRTFRVYAPLPTPTYLGSIKFDPAINGDVTVRMWFDDAGKLQYEVVDDGDC